MILKTDAGAIIKREDNPVTREDIVKRLAEIQAEIPKAEAHLEKLKQLESMVTTDLTTFDSLVPTPAVAPESPAPTTTEPVQPVVNPTPAQ